MLRDDDGNNQKESSNAQHSFSNGKQQLNQRHRHDHPFQRCHQAVEQERHQERALGGEQDNASSSSRTADIVDSAWLRRHRDGDRHYQSEEKVYYDDQYRYQQQQDDAGVLSSTLSMRDYEEEEETALSWQHFHQAGLLPATYSSFSPQDDARKSAPTAPAAEPIFVHRSSNNSFINVSQRRETSVTPAATAGASSSDKEIRKDGYTTSGSRKKQRNSGGGGDTTMSQANPAFFLFHRLQTSAISSLSKDERLLALFDIHGVSEINGPHRGSGRPPHHQTKINPSQLDGLVCVDVELASLVLSTAPSSSSSGTTCTARNIAAAASVNTRRHGHTISTPPAGELSQQISSFTAPPNSCTTAAEDFLKRLRSGHVVVEKSLVQIFLEVEDFDSRKAAKRLYHYLQLHAKLLEPVSSSLKFEHGMNMAMVEMKPTPSVEGVSPGQNQATFSECEYELLESGFCQLLPSRDRSGRIIFWMSIPILIHCCTATSRESGVPIRDTNQGEQIRNASDSLTFEEELPSFLSPQEASPIFSPTEFRAEREQTVESLSNPSIVWNEWAKQKAIWYTAMKAVEDDVITRQNGAVLVLVASGSCKRNENSAIDGLDKTRREEYRHRDKVEQQETGEKHVARETKEYDGVQVEKSGGCLGRTAWQQHSSEQPDPINVDKQQHEAAVACIKTEMIELFQLFTTALPIKVKAIHILCESGNLVPRQIFEAAGLMDINMRARMKCHFIGSCNDIGPTLSGFGIPESIIPIERNNDGTFSTTTEYHKQWIQSLRCPSHAARTEAPLAPASVKQGKRSSGPTVTSASGDSPLQAPISSELQQRERDGKVDTRESSEGVGPNQNVITDPGPFDVLMGARSKVIDESAGNLQLRRLVDLNSEIYNSVPRAMKTKIAEKIVLRIKESGGRFLQSVSGIAYGWVEVKDEVARAKVSHAFRNQRRLQSEPSTSTDKL